MSRLLDKAKNFVADKVAEMKKPEASITDVDLGHVGCDGIRYDAKVSVTNPYGTSIPICQISYTFKSAGRGEDKEWLQGTTPKFKGKFSTCDMKL